MKPFLINKFNFKFCIFNFAFIQLLFLILLIITAPIKAQQRLNNIYGMGMAQPHFEDIKKVAELVNSNGGDWGYVTLVIQENDRNIQKWQEILDLLRAYHLIPIIRLGTVPEGESWRRPTKDDAIPWANFLDSLNWVVKNRYVVLFNEPNHGSEWGSEVDAYNYAEIAKEFAEKLKQKNKDFFIMLAGFDSSAPQSIPVYQDEYSFLRNVMEKISVADFERLFDGWSSHSYPNPGFSGSPWDNGRKSIRGYDWELTVLRELGIQKELPVFITETGWVRGNENTIVENFRIAYQNVWMQDERVVAITPFIFDYQGQPFLNFSWKLPSAEALEEQVFYPQYFAVQAMQKQKGEPEQIDKGELQLKYGPYKLVANSNYHFRLKLKNTGQAVWSKNEGYQLVVSNGQKDMPFEYIFSDLTQIKPFQETDIDLYIKTISRQGKYKVRFALRKDNRKVIETNDWSLDILPLPSLEFKVDLYPKFSSAGDDFEIQVFDEQEGLVFKKNSINVKYKTGYLYNIQNIIIGRQYRVVILKPHYLPRQEFITFRRGKNLLKFKRMYPLDFNVDGKLDGKDLGALIEKPELIRLYFP